MNLPVKLGTSLLMDPVAFDHLQRVGNMLASSPLFPEHLRKGTKEQAVANGVLVMNMAARLNEDPLTVAQNIYFVGGTSGWKTSYMIAKANQHGVFRDPIDWEVKGGGDGLSVTAHGVLSSTGKRVSIAATMQMAKEEGWTKNPKYKTMPELMLRYRSATALIRLYCPEIMVGLPTTLDVEARIGMKNVTPDEDDFAFAGTPEPKRVATARTVEVEIVDPDTGEVSGPKLTPEPEPEPKQEAKTEPEFGHIAQTHPAEATMPGPKASDAREDYKKIYELVTQDLIDGAPVAATKSFWAEKLELMKVAAPDLYEALQRDFAASDE